MKNTLIKTMMLSLVSGFALAAAHATPVSVYNFSFEADVAAVGGDVTTVPAGWTAFNQRSAGDIGSENSGGTPYTVNNPLAAPAAGNQYCYINMFNTGVPGGIYQDIGALQPNTTYTLTVAIGSRADRINSSGVIELINGTDETGTVLASGGGMPATQNTWQDYTVTFTTGSTVSGDLTIALVVFGNGTTIQADFDNVQLNATAVPVAPSPSSVSIYNPSFEADVASVGGDVTAVPAGWAAFNEAGATDIGSENSGGTQYTVNNPLAPPAAGNQYCYINMFTSGTTGGIYQDVGALQANTTYTLTVAIGSRADRINSAGIISLVNGSDNTGTVLASGGGLPANQNTWQDYIASFTTGSSVSGDLTVELSVPGNSTTIQADFDNVLLTTTPVVQAFTLTAAKGASGSLILTATGGSANSGYTLLTTTNLATATWTTNSTGTLDGNGAFSNAIPFTALPPASFFQLRTP